MHVRLTAGDAPRVELEEATDCRRLDVRVPASRSTVEIVEALRAHNAGEGLDEDHVRLSVAWLRKAALSAPAPADPADFAAMLAFADSHGWCSEDGTLVRAHLEREQSA